MKHLVMKEHTEHCTWNNNPIYKNYSPINKYLLYLKSDFVLLEVCNCIQGHLNDGEFIESLIKVNLKGIEKIKSYYVNRGYKYGSELNKIIKEGNIFSHYVHECNYIYGNACTTYCVVSKILFVSKVANNDNINLLYKDAKDYLIKNNYEYLLDELDMLYEMNHISIIKENYYSFSNISNMRKELNKIIKQKT